MKHLIMILFVVLCGCGKPQTAEERALQESRDAFYWCLNRMGDKTGVEKVCGKLPGGDFSQTEQPKQ